MYLTRDQVRELDRRASEEFGLPGVVLMENAGRGAAELLVALGVHGRVVVCCGKGNNGGDGLVIARHLDLARVPVRVLLCCPPDALTGDAGLNYRVALRGGLDLVPCPDGDGLRRELGRAEWVVDALFGTGLAGAVRPPFDAVIAAVNDSPARVFAVDVPSGLDADTGTPLGSAVRAEHTATFVAAKQGFANPAAAEWVGRVHVLGIGAPRTLVEQFAGG